jgi:hypothetical protein
MALSTLFGQCFENGLFYVRRQLGVMLPQRKRGLCQMGKTQGEEIRGSKGNVPGEEFVGNTS